MLGKGEKKSDREKERGRYREKRDRKRERELIKEFAMPIKIFRVGRFSAVQLLFNNCKSVRPVQKKVMTSFNNRKKVAKKGL